MCNWDMKRCEVQSALISCIIRVSWSPAPVIRALLMRGRSGQAEIWLQHSNWRCGAIGWWLMLMITRHTSDSPLIYASSTCMTMVWCTLNMHDYGMIHAQHAWLWYDARSTYMTMVWCTLNMHDYGMMHHQHAWLWYDMVRCRGRVLRHRTVAIERLPRSEKLRYTNDWMVK